MYDNRTGSTPYHYVIAPSGHIFEGRPLDYLGQHVRLANTGRIGIAFSGTFSETGNMPTQAELDAAEWLIGHLTERFPTITEVVAHNQVIHNTGNSDFVHNQTMLDWIEQRNPPRPLTIWEMQLDR